uniref:ATP-dependent DNA helicase n=1 Tax=Trypanosoma congolense (strain IL3000) TaxID=1068625 RepID=G0V0Z3_TRYCI|nr:unnamed protein product [Trypanosoma congolense IL3000]
MSTKGALTVATGWSTGGICRKHLGSEPFRTSPSHYARSLIPHPLFMMPSLALKGFTFTSRLSRHSPLLGRPKPCAIGSSCGVRMPTLYGGRRGFSTIAGGSCDSRSDVNACSASESQEGGSVVPCGATSFAIPHEQKLLVDKPPLICQVRRLASKRTGPTTVRMEAFGKCDNPRDSLAMLASPSVGSTGEGVGPGGHFTGSRPTRRLLVKLSHETTTYAVSSGVTEQQAHAEDEEQRSELVDDEVEDLYSEDDDPIFHAATSRSTKRDDESVLVLNIFTHRVVWSSSPTIRLLSALGIGLRRGERELDVIDPEALMRFRSKLRGNEVSWPSGWRSGLFVAVRRKLLFGVSAESAVAEIRKLIRDRYQEATRECVTTVVNSASGQNLDETHLLDKGKPADNYVTCDERLVGYADLNEEQKQILDFVMQGYNTYIGGGAGTGKSLLLQVIKQELVKRGLSVATTATTGIAARRLNGKTLHHCFGVNIHGEFTRRAELRAFDVIIVDEVSMLSKEVFEALEYQLRRAHGVSLPFGGVQVILSGDFLQLSAICSLSLVHSRIFRRNFAMLKLHQVVRQCEDSLFLHQLQELRRGIVPHDLQDTVQFLPAEKCSQWLEEGGADAVRLLPTNKEVEEVNQKQLDRLAGDAIVYPALLQPPSLCGQWTPTYIIEITAANPDSVDIRSVAALLEEYVLEFLQATPYASEYAFHTICQRYIVVYKLFTDAFAFRARIPPNMSEEEVRNFKFHLNGLETWLPMRESCLRLRETFESPHGLHTDADDYTLSRYAELHSMSSPLHLKIGAKVMLRANLTPGLVNGSIGTVVRFVELKENNLPVFVKTLERAAAVNIYKDYLRYEFNLDTILVPEVQFENGHRAVIPPTVFSVGGLSNTNHYSMDIVAVPLSLAYAFTVHKVQGLTLVGRVHLELSRMWPCDHLLYVAMSRVRNPEQLAVSSFRNDLVRCASECLLFDESLPPVKKVEILPSFFKASWITNPKRRKARSLRRRIEGEQPREGEKRHGRVRSRREYLR